MKKNKKRTNAVTEVIGAVLLLGMAIGLFSVLNIIVYSLPSNPSIPAVNLIANLEENPATGAVEYKIIIEHNGGESLYLETVNIIIRIDDDPKSLPSLTAIDSNGDNRWNIGERYVYPEAEYTSISDKAEVIVIDLETNSVLMM